MITKVDATTAKNIFQTGFTLLEMLLVLFLIGLMASTTLMITEGVEDQAKYDDTKRRMEIMRKAIVGDPTRTVNGGPEISGFVADMGRLPLCIAELLTAGVVSGAGPTFVSPCNVTKEIFSWQQDVDSQVWSGWRGPYIQVQPERNGELRFRDGYGNSDPDATIDARKSGWNWTLSASDTIAHIQSRGFDGSELYPIGATVSDAIPLVNPSDYSIELQNWDSFQIQFQNTSTAAINIPLDSLRMKLSYAENGAINTWPNNAPDRENSDYLSSSFPVKSITIPSSSQAGSFPLVDSDTITVPMGTTLTGGTTLSFTNNGNVLFPSGSVSVVTTDSISVPTASNLSGTNLTLTNAGDITFPKGSTVTLDSGLQFPENLTPVLGSYSLTARCDDTSNESSVSGRRFDGLCTRYGDDITPVDYTALNQPYILQAPPRNPAIMPPSPLIWTIQ